MVEVPFRTYNLLAAVVIGLELCFLGGMLIDMNAYHSNLDKIKNDGHNFMSDYTYMAWPNMKTSSRAHQLTDHIRYVSNRNECQNLCDSTSGCQSYAMPIKNNKICILKADKAYYLHFYDNFYDMGHHVWTRTRKPFT